MSYDKQTWTTGEVITANKLNHMEDGIAAGGGSVLVVGYTADGETLTLDKTWQEIYDASLAIMMYQVDDDHEMLYIAGEALENKGLYHINLYSLGDPTAWTFIASSKDGYPSYGE